MAVYEDNALTVENLRIRNDYLRKELEFARQVSKKSNALVLKSKLKSIHALADSIKLEDSRFKLRQILERIEELSR